MKKNFSWFGLVFFVFSLFFVNTFSAEAASCSPTLQMYITNQKGENVTEASISSVVILYVRVIPSPDNSCSSAVVKKVYFSSDFVSVSGYIGEADIGNGMLLSKSLDIKYQQGVSGIKKGNGFVAVGDTARAGAVVELSDGGIKNTPYVSFKVTDGVDKPIDPKPPVDAGPVTPKPTPTPTPKPTPDQNPTNSGTPPVNSTNGNTNDGRPDNVSSIGNLGQGCDRLKKQFELVGGEVPEALAAQCGTVGGTINRIINLALGLAGSLAVLFIFLGGIRYLTAAGSETQAKSARGMMQWAVLGLVVIVLAFVIVRVVTSLLT